MNTNSNLTILTPLCWVMALLTSSVMSLCRVYYTHPLICVSTNSRQTHNSNLTIPTPLCRVMALLTSGVMSLCGVYYTHPLICVTTNNQLTKYSVSVMREAAIHCFMSYSLTAHCCLCCSVSVFRRNLWHKEKRQVVSVILVFFQNECQMNVMVRVADS